MKSLPPKNENFQMKNSYIFHISAQNIDCGYSLEPPRRGDAVLMSTHNLCFLSRNKNKNSAEGVIAPAGAKVTGATIRMWLLNEYFILSSAYLENWVEKNVDKVPNGAHIFLASAIPCNGYIFSTDFSYYTAQ